MPCEGWADWIGNYELNSKWQLFRLANPPQANWCSIWDGKPRKRYLLAVHYAWSVYVLLFNSMVLNIRAYGRDHLGINTIAIAFSEIVGVFIAMYLILYTRRRWLWSGILSITSGVLAYFTWLIPETRNIFYIEVCLVFDLQLFIFIFTSNSARIARRRIGNDAINGHQSGHIDWALFADGLHSRFGGDGKEENAHVFGGNLVASLVPLGAIHIHVEKIRSRFAAHRIRHSNRSRRCIDDFDQLQ